MCLLIKSTRSACLQETLDRAFMPRRPTIPFLSQHQDEKSYVLELNEDLGRTHHRLKTSALSLMKSICSFRHHLGSRTRSLNARPLSHAQLTFRVLCIQDSVYAKLSISVAVHDCDSPTICRAVHAVLRLRYCHTSHLLPVLF